MPAYGAVKVEPRLVQADQLFFHEMTDTAPLVIA
jgi:hypothetical protein